jgi:hypothetical protein
MSFTGKINNFAKLCVICDKINIEDHYELCKLCLMNQRINLRNDFINWTSGNEKVDSFIQQMQLNIGYITDIVLEWVPYNQFIDIKEIRKNKLFIVYLAKWKDGPLEYNKDIKKCKRNPNKAIELKCFYNINEFLNEV